MSTITLHPFKEGILTILKQHFAEEIVKRFVLVFETEIYNKDVEQIWRQKRDDMMILEIRYNNPDNSSVYICDVRSTWSRKVTEYHILKYVTDKYKSGKIWFDETRISKPIRTGEHETIDFSGSKYKLDRKKVN